MPIIETAPAVWKPLVICPHPEMSRRIGTALRELGLTQVSQLSEYPRTVSIADVTSRYGANLCLIDVASDQEQGLRLMSEAAPIMPVVALNPGNDGDLILRCLRLGASEFVPDAAVETLRGVLDRLNRARAPSTQQRLGKVYCTIPGKPGCGASTLAVHLAMEMHSVRNETVLLVDTDPFTGSLGFMLKLKSEFHIGDVLRDWKRMDEDLWSRLTVPFGGVHVLLAPETPATRIEINRETAAEVLKFWRERYSVVLVDTPDLRFAWESGLALLSDEVLLVTTNELAALHATRRALDFFDASTRDPARLHLIVNRYDPATGLKRDDLKTAFSMDPFAVLSNDYHLIQTALLDGKPAPAGSRFRGSIQTLCKQLRGERPAEKKNGSWLGRLRK